MFVNMKAYEYIYTACPHIQTTAGYAPAQLTLHIYEKDYLNKRSAKHVNKLVARCADTQLGFSCVSAPLATNVDLWNPIV